jgi:DNA-binding NarL/FixJ family response regulator
VRLLLGKSNSVATEGLNTTMRRGDMPKSQISILVAEDFEPFRQFVCAIFCTIPGLEVICETLDGVEAVEKAKALQPDIVLLDIGLQRLNGIEAARHITRVAPATKILFLSQESSVEMVQAAIEAGGHGYVVKTEAEKELATALDTILRGEQFLGTRYSNSLFARTSESDASSRRRPVSTLRAGSKIV